MPRPYVDKVALARQAQKAGNLAQARRLYRQGIAEGDLHAFNNLAQLLIDGGRKREGEALFRKGVAGGDPLAAKNLALFLIEEGRPKAADRALRRAREMGRPARVEEVLGSRQYAETQAVAARFDRARRAKRMDARWRLIAELQRSGGKAAFDIALDALRSRSSTDRALGAHVLSQLGFTSPTPPFRAQSVRALRAAMKIERSAHALAAISFALCRLWSRGSIADLARLATHRNAEIREVLAAELIHTTMELGWGEEAPDARVIGALLKLTRDRVPEVRDWACFSLGNSEQDSAEIRQAFVDRLSDRHFDTRVEAISALARREDSRAKEPLLRVLEQRSWRMGTWVTADLVTFAGRSEDSRFVPHLVELRERWHPDVEELKAIRIALRKLTRARVRP